MGILSNLFSWFKPESNKEEPLIPRPVAPGKLRTTQHLQQLFAACALEKYWTTVSPLVSPGVAVNLTPADEALFTVGESKVGGQPDLPDYYEWPKDEKGKPLSFIAQFNLAELAPFEKENILPRQGMLYFFYSAEQEVWGFDPADRSGFRVIYYPLADKLSKQSFPEDLTEDSIFKPNRLTFESALYLPDPQHHSVEHLIADEDAENYSEALSIVYEENRVLGYAHYIQSSMELECALVTGGAYCGDASGYNSLARDGAEIEKLDWILLFQIGSEDDKTGMMWGDSGSLYFWITKRDLAARSFEKAWCILQCY